MNLNKPSKLNPGDVIGVIAPSAGLADLFPQRIESARKNIENLGFQLKFGKRWVRQGLKEITLRFCNICL